ncbi:MAG: imidazolonepropionase [Deltaproteobacteria bacterium]|nr:imidazolonepropionase [Deltaproteobacteria bacterium]
MTIIKNISQLVTHSTDNLNPQPTIYNNLSLQIHEGKILKLSPNSKLGRYKKEKIIDVKGKAVIPGLIECHTHAIFGGNRIDDFEKRSNGISYLEILKAGGGINYTVKCTRSTKESELLKTGLKRVKKFISNGITTLEIKSGYGLSFEDELKLLRIINTIKKKSDIEIIPTFLGAHTFPEEYRNEKGKYIDIIIKKMLPVIKRRKLSQFCDVFTEKGAFNLNQTKQIFNAAKRLGFKLKIHADQLTNSGAALLAAKYKCISAEHLEKSDEKSILALKKAGVTAVLLPYATIFTGHNEFAKARMMIDNGLRVAISTDFNPGSSYTFNLLFCAMLGITQMRMTINEALMAITINAAYALGLQERKGTIEVGKDADLLVLNTNDYREIFYNPDPSLIKLVISKGKIIFENS